MLLGLGLVAILAKVVAANLEDLVLRDVFFRVLNAFAYLTTMCIFAQHVARSEKAKKMIHSSILNALCKHGLCRPRALAAAVLCSIAQSASRNKKHGNKRTRPVVTL